MARMSCIGWRSTRHRQVSQVSSFDRVTGDSGAEGRSMWTIP